MLAVLLAVGGGGLGLGLALYTGGRKWLNGLAVRCAQSADVLAAGGQTYEALSLHWAWGTGTDVEFVLSDLPGAESPSGCRLPEPRPAGDLRIAAVVAIGLVLLYQRVRPATRSRRECVFWPNCSNYAIGVLRRYPVVKAIRMIRDRVKRCTGVTAGVDLP